MKQVVVCPKCGGERIEDCDYTIIKVHIPPCKKCGSSLVSKKFLENKENENEL